MKKKAIITAAIILLLNIILGVIISSYGIFNCCVNSVIIAVTALLITLSFKLKDALTISLSFLFGITGLIEIILGSIMLAQFSDNFILLAVILLIAAEVGLLAIAQTISRKIK